MESGQRPGFGGAGVRGALRRGAEKRGGEVGADGEDGDPGTGEAAARGGSAGGDEALAEPGAGLGRNPRRPGGLRPGGTRQGQGLAIDAAPFAAGAHLAVALEAAGEQLLSEPQLLAHQRTSGEMSFSIRLADDRHHRPDLIALGEPPTVIEVELTAKDSVRLDEILTGCKTAIERGRFARVRYYCSSEALHYVKRSIERVDAREEVTVEALPDEDLFATPITPERL